MTQIEEMREKFEAWYKNQILPCSPDFKYYTKEALEWAFQAAYTPRPSVEVVRQVICKELKVNPVTHSYVFLAKAVIDAIFNQQEKPCN
jgi:hypothetical protein